jgi:hypothetical protein
LGALALAASVGQQCRPARRAFWPRVVAIANPSHPGPTRGPRYAKRTQFCLPSRVWGRVTTHSNARRAARQVSFVISSRGETRRQQPGRTIPGRRELSTDKVWSQVTRVPPVGPCMYQCLFRRCGLNKFSYFSGKISSAGYRLPTWGRRYFSTFGAPLPLPNVRGSVHTSI